MHVKQKGATIGLSFIHQPKVPQREREKKFHHIFDHGNGNKNFYLSQKVAIGMVVFNRILDIKCLCCALI